MDKITGSRLAFNGTVSLFVWGLRTRHIYDYLKIFVSVRQWNYWHVKWILLMKELFLFPFVIIIIIIIIIIYFEEIIKELLKLFFIVVGFRNTTKHKPSLIVTESKVCHPIAFKIWLHACNGANNTILMYLSGARTWWDHIIISRRCQQLLYLKCIYIYYRL